MWKWIAGGAAVVVGVPILAMTVRGMMQGGSSGGGPQQPEGPKDPFAQFRGQTGFQEMDGALGGLLSWTRSTTDVAARAAQDKKNQENALRIVNGTISAIASAAG